MDIEMLTPHKEARKVLDALLLERSEQARLRMDEVFAYAYTQECRQCVISRYFGQRMQKCGKSCDVCLGVAKMVKMPKLNAPSAQAIPDIGRLILQTINDLPHPETRSNIGNILAGNPNSPVKGDVCPQFGVLEGMAQNTISTLVGELLDMGLLDRDYIEDLPVVRISALGREALAKTDMILRNPEVSKGTRYVKPQIPIRPQVQTPPMGESEDDRFEKLRVWRRITAQKMNVPPYSILPDHVLRIIAKLNPKSLESLRVAYDTLQDKLNYYGSAIMDVLKNEGK
jgi:ATP-dependent DNA helicase RecQ